MDNRAEGELQTHKDQTEPMPRHEGCDRDGWFCWLGLIDNVCMYG